MPAEQPARARRCSETPGGGGRTNGRGEQAPGSGRGGREMCFRAYLLVNVFLPLLHGLKRRRARDVKHDKGADSLLVVHARHVAEPLLSCVARRSNRDEEKKGWRSAKNKQLPAAVKCALAPGGQTQGGKRAPSPASCVYMQTEATAASTDAKEDAARKKKWRELQQKKKKGHSLPPLDCTRNTPAMSHSCRRTTVLLSTLSTALIFAHCV